MGEITILLCLIAIACVLIDTCIVLITLIFIKIGLLPELKERFIKEGYLSE